MIESQTKLPAQQGRVGTIWTRSFQAARRFSAEVGSQVRALPGSPSAKRLLRDARSFAVKPAHIAQLRAFFSRFLSWARTGLGDGPLINRFALHLVVVLLAIGVVGISQINLPQVDFLLPTPTPAPDLGEHAVTAPLSNRGGPRFVNTSSALFQVPVPHTIVAERDRMEVITYTVQPNDNVWFIAQGFGLKAETVLWANPAVEKAPDLLSVGQKLFIPPVDGIYYTVKKGDTVQKLAKDYKTTVEKIVGFKANDLQEPYTLTAGQKVMLPDGQKKMPALTNLYPMTYVGSAPKGAPKGSGRFAWPTSGTLTQAFWSGHSGIDIANRRGTAIRAADAGYVVLAGVDTWGYGNQIVIDHGNGFKTRYAHLSRIDVKAGQTVKKNQVIGLMGSTGHSTGPHLHFEIIRNGVVRNPQGYLP
jgi:murein DD-endopeptidase MepM/ murein hydrolase activator NlpD